MGAYGSTESIPANTSSFKANFEANLLSKIIQQSPKAPILVLANQIGRYDGCSVGNSRVKSENYVMAERLWEMCSPLDLAHLSCCHSTPQIRLYAFEGLCVLLKTMQNFGHSPYWRLRFTPSEMSVEELQDLLYCTFIQIQMDRELVKIVNGTSVQVSAAVKKLGWMLLTKERQRTLEDLLLHTHPDSREAEQILIRRSTSEPTLETYFLIERQIERNPMLLQYMALFQKPRDVEL